MRRAEHIQHAVVHEAARGTVELNSALNKVDGPCHEQTQSATGAQGSETKRVRAQNKETQLSSRRKTESQTNERRRREREERNQRVTETKRRKRRRQKSTWAVKTQMKNAPLFTSARVSCKYTYKLEEGASSRRVPVMVVVPEPDMRPRVHNIDPEISTSPLPRR
jgi:hypothetical protein